MINHSLLKSTFSLLSFIAVVSLCALCIITRNVDVLKDLAFLLLGGYGVKKGLELTNGKT